LDAVRAGREALARKHLTSPRQRGHREALRVLHTTRAGVVAAAPDDRVEHRATVQALRLTAQRALTAQHDAKQLEAELRQLVTAIAPDLLAQPGIGPINAAQLLISWFHPGRFRSEAAFAMLAGAARSRPPRARSSAIGSTGAGTGS